MKKTTLLLHLLAITVMGVAQSQRMVLAEEFTQASCGPCASQNPAFNTLLRNNTSKVISLKHQTSWPGYDPMNLQNPTEVATRVSYYSVTGVPHARMDGIALSGAPSNWTQAKINTEYAIPSSFTINLSHTFSPDYDSIFITCEITASQAFTSNGALKAHIAMVEEQINFASAPGTNGEKNFENVMRKMYPSAAGTTLPATWTNGQSQTITIAAAIPSYIYSKSQIGVVAFIQSDGNKAVQQAAYSIPQPLPNDIAAVSIAGIPLLQCTTGFTPTITIKNLGTDTLKNCTINYKIDNNNISTQSWTGLLAKGVSTTVALPALTATAGNHTFTSYTSAPNGVTDFDTKNDQIVTSFLINSLIGATSPLVEGYTTTTFPPVGWIVNNPDNGATWTRKTAAGGFGTSTACAKMDFFNSAVGNIDEFYAKNVDFSGSSTASLTFNVAYAQYSTENDQLDVQVSTDCGATWVTVYTKYGSTLKTAPPVNTNVFTPTATQWRAEVVDLNAFAGQANVLIKFVATSDFGNNLYIDDINLSNSGVGINDKNELISNVNVYPNPATNYTTIQFNLIEESSISLTLIDDLGRNVLSENLGTVNAGEKTHSLNITDLSNGLYYLTIRLGNNTITKKVSISK